MRKRIALLTDYDDGALNSTFSAMNYAKNAMKIVKSAMKSCAFTEF
jgi:hypothetical protein